MSTEELEKLAGKWRCVAVEAEGKSLPSRWYSESSATVQGDTFRTVVRSVNYSGTIVLIANQDVDWIDLHFTEGLKSGTTSPGIYELRGDELTICLGRPGLPRPREFSAGRGSARALGLLRRAIR